MAKITKDEIKRLAKLSHISLSDDEVASLATELDAILDYVEKLQAVDTSGVEPTSQVTGLVDVWREDTPYVKQPKRQDILSNTPEQQDGYIKVRRVL